MFGRGYLSVCVCFGFVFLKGIWGLTSPLGMDRNKFDEFERKSEQFWGERTTLQSSKRDFDRFVASVGGIVNPALNLPPRGFATFNPYVTQADTFPINIYKPLPQRIFLQEMNKRRREQKEERKRTREQQEENKRTREQQENNKQKNNLVQSRQPKKLKHLAATLPHGCKDLSGFHFEGDTWFSRGCRRHKCLHFNGGYFVETDSCDTEIHNTTYKCVIQVNLKENYPKCCPRYECNPDNLGNRVNVQ